MAVSTVQLNGTTLMTVNDTTATASDVAQNKYFYGANGVKTAGTASGGGGGGGQTDSGVRFLDYDGTVLHTYTASEFAELSSMPANPSHTGLTAQGWNWSLSNAKTHVAKYKNLDIGQMYVTDDGATRIYCHFDEGTLEPYLGICPNGTVTIDWGDNSQTDTLSGTSLSTIKRIQHIYASAGDYTIRIIPSNNAGIGFIGTTSMTFVLQKDLSSSAEDLKYINTIYKIELGNNIVISTSAFYNCYSLKSINIPKTVTSIGNYAFSYCSSLKSINIPDTVTSIGTYAFQYCYSLKSINIPNTVTSVGTRAFQYCYSLKSVNLPDTVTSIGNYAFQNCSSLESINLPDNVTITSTGSYMFRYCYSLKSINIPNTVTSIGNYAFQYCNSLESVNLPDTVTSIGNYAFNYCYSLKSINIPDTITNIGSYAFQYCYTLKSINIPNTITSIGGNTFDYCYSLESINIPNTVTSIGSYAFQSCKLIRSINIPKNITSIGNNTFAECSCLNEINVPEDVTSIGTLAFASCYGVSEYHLLPTTPPTLSNINAFNNIPSDCIIYVPYSSDHSVLTAYQTASNWSTYASYMQEEPQ